MTHEHPANVSQEALTTSVPSATTICVEEDVTKGLRLKLGNLKIQCDKYDSESSSEPGSPVPDTPACKGYIIESDLADQLLGERYYFVALVQLEQGPPEYCVFSLSPFHRMVSQVDKNSCFHHRYHAQLSEPVVNFRIGDWQYCWDTQNHTLSFESFQTGSKSPQLTRHNALLYVTLEEAKLCVDTFQWINLPAPGNLATPPLSRTGDSTPSPPSIAGVPPTVTGVNLPFISGYFGPSASQEAIDRWVDYSVANDQATRDGTNLRCPETGCKASSRRPHALKTHLYTHYNIKPHDCRLCGISVLTEANLWRHMRNIHTCPGCHLVGLVAPIKAHKAICTRAATAPTRKRNRTK